ncbi:MAG: hypothetical protein K2X07_05960 [Caulobacteraceae bacterium]|nr:hypothetical protein [Caulobacteraceae bacterium]
MRLLPVTSWDDWAALATIASLVIALLAALIAWRQIKHQLVEGRRQSAFNAFLHFSERFLEFMELRSELKDRFERKDKDLKLREIKFFYQKYWNIQINEWEMFRAGLLPVDVYSGWLCYVHDNIVGDFRMGYFNADGQPGHMTARQAFETIALGQLMRSQPECRDFFKRLAERKHDWTPTHRPENDERLSARVKDMRDFLTEMRREYQIAAAWRLT